MAGWLNWLIAWRPGDVTMLPPISQIMIGMTIMILIMIWMTIMIIIQNWLIGGMGGW